MSFYQTDYAELDDLKRYLRVPGNYEGTINTSEDVFDDIPLALAITAASRAIDKACGRQFGLMESPATLVYTADYDSNRSRYMVPIDDVMTTSGMIINYDPNYDYDFSSTVEDDTYNLWPYNAPAKGRPWTHVVLHGGAYLPTHQEAVAITAKYGWTEVPDTIKQATLLQAARIWKRRDAPFGVAGSPEMGNELRLLNRIDPDVEVLIQPYKRLWGAA